MKITTVKALAALVEAHDERAVDRYNESVIKRVLDEAEVEKRRQEMNKELNKQ
jgi:hypothetical protein